MKSLLEEVGRIPKTPPVKRIVLLVEDLDEMIEKADIVGEIARRLDEARNDYDVEVKAKRNYDLEKRRKEGDYPIELEEHVCVRFPANFNLEEFADSFISEVAGCLKGKELVSVAELYAAVEKNVGNKMGISRRSVRHLHHCFHWELFIGKNPRIEYFQDGNGANYARLLKDISDDDARAIKKRIFENYGGWLNAKVNPEAS